LKLNLYLYFYNLFLIFVDNKSKLWDDIQISDYFL